MKFSMLGKVKKVFLVLFIACFALGVIVVPACDKAGSSAQNYSFDPTDDFSDFTWPSRGLATMLPAPASTFGEINTDSTDRLSVDVGNVTSEQFDSYVAACEEKGFTENYSKTSGNYRGETTEGYKLHLSFDDEYGYMSIYLDAPEESDGEAGGEAAAPEEAEAAQEEPEAPSSDSSSENSGGANGGVIPADAVTPSFKEAMDSYETFFDEYVAFMQKYENTTDYSPEMLTDFNTYMERYTETMQKLDEIDEENLSPADYAYYTEVMLRVNQKLASI